MFGFCRLRLISLVMSYQAEASLGSSGNEPGPRGSSNGDRPVEFTVPVLRVGGGDRSYSTQIIKTGSHESSREAVSGNECYRRCCRLCVELLPRFSLLPPSRATSPALYLATDLLIAYNRGGRSHQRTSQETHPTFLAVYRERTGS